VTLRFCIPGIDGGEDLDPDLLKGIYDRVKQSEFKPGPDHVQQVMKVEQMIVGKKPVSNDICLLEFNTPLLIAFIICLLLKPCIC